MKNIIIISILLCFLSVNQAAATSLNKANSALAMPDQFSADIAQQVLDDGGNAIDAAIAAQFVLAVTLPEAGNVGGGGFMLIYKDKKAQFLDYREVAPLQAHRDMYLDKQGNVIPNKSLYSILSTGVPGTVDGMWQAHQKYGSKSWQYLLKPAIELAKNGFNVPQQLEEGIHWRIDSFKKNNINVNFAQYFGQVKANTIFKQPELAQTLQRISDLGRDGFYLGETATLITNFMDKHGGILSKQDLANYHAKWRKPIVKKWRDYTVVTSPPPSSGGIAILQWLQMYDMVKEKYSPLQHNSGKYIHLLAEIGKRVFADRAEYLGDPDFIKVPQEKLLAPEYIAKRASDISDKSISISENMKPGLPESEDTTHFSIVDQWGNAVSNTTTINYTFGSGIIVDGAGFILNDEMDDFSARAGVPNIYGAIGGKANEIQPNKRMLSSMTPTILLQNEQVKLVTGSPGGTTIISSVYESILNAIEFNMTAQETVDATRFHHQLWPKNVIRYFGDLPSSTTDELTQMGYTLDKRRFGDLQFILRKDDKWQAASQSTGRGKSIATNH
jgi:gamma-glutamyltranspeptidase/glutathione hydrolase